jgi:hypothetical protein
LIFLDTNILRGISMTGTSADLIRTLRAAGVQEVAVPWAVMEELAAQHAVRYAARHRAVGEAVEALDRVTPWSEPQVQVPNVDLERVRKHWRGVYSTLVDVVPTSASVLQEALFREANLLPPCKELTVKGSDKQVKVGSRDASIWLTAVQYARDHEDEVVYFVSSNIRDFGEGGPYPSPMDADVEGLADRFVHFTSLDDVVKQFTETTDADEEAVRAALMVPESLDMITAEAWKGQRLALRGEQPPATPFWCTVNEKYAGAPGWFAPPDKGFALGWFFQPHARLESVRDISAYRIGDHVWCVATARWLLASPVLLGPSQILVNGLAAWETRVLVSPTGTGTAPTVLRSTPPQPVTEEEAEAARTSTFRPASFRTGSPTASVPEEALRAVAEFAVTSWELAAGQEAPDE